MKTEKPLNFRAMTDTDLDQVFQVRTATIENAISMEKLASYGITQQSVSNALKTDSIGFVCELNQNIIGFCMGNHVTAEVQVLAVLPEQEGQGIAARLMNELQTALFKYGHPNLWLMTTPDAKLRAYGFYQHLGWQATGEMINGEEKFVLLNKPNHQNDR